MARNLYDLGAKLVKKLGGRAAGEHTPGRPSFGASQSENRLPAGYGAGAQPKAAPSVPTRSEGSAQQDGTAPATAQSGEGGAPSGGFDDYYSRLIATLRSYGVNMELPTLNELYDQLAAFLRPSVDRAIEQRRSYGDTVLAELDADAYSRGMGGSSYLSSMKNREYDAAASDIASLEANYNATLAQYLYNASNELRSIQAEFEKMRRQHQYEMERLRMEQQHSLRLAALRSSGRNTGSDPDPGTNESNELTPEQYAANYEASVAYMRLISGEERNNVFTSMDPYWVGIRRELMQNLTGEDFARLRRRFYTGSGSGHGANGNNGADPTNPRPMTD